MLVPRVELMHLLRLEIMQVVFASWIQACFDIVDLIRLALEVLN